MKDVKLTSEQLKSVREIAAACCNFADHIYKMVCDRGLDKVNGCSFKICVDPGWMLTNRMVYGGQRDSDFGEFTLCKGCLDKKYKTTGKDNTLTYQMLFADKELRQKIMEAVEDYPEMNTVWLSANDDPAFDEVKQDGSLAQS